MDIRLIPPEDILETTVARLPLSKSIAARVLLLHAITPGARALDPSLLPDCDDTRVMAAALARDCGDVDVEACGTAARFLTAYFAARPGTDVTLGGTPRLNARPVAPLVDALRSLGADIEYAGVDGRMPLRIKGKTLRGGTVRLDASASSQFASALALIAPLMEHPLAIDLGGEIASMPYLKMTLAMLGARGVDSSREGYTVTVGNTPCRNCPPESEADWSAAAFWYAIAAVTAGWVTLPGLALPSLQGDSVLASVGDRFGVLTAFSDGAAELSATPDIFSRLDMDMSDYPDLVPVFAVVGCLINIPYRLTGVANLRHKESDRLAALAGELRRCGWVLEVGPDSIGWEGAAVPVTEMPRLDARGDHRLAMSFAAISVFVPGLVISGAEAVGKSYPGFWDDLRDAGFTVDVLGDGDAAQGISQQ